MLNTTLLFPLWKFYCVERHVLEDLMTMNHSEKAFRRRSLFGFPVVFSATSPHLIECLEDASIHTWFSVRDQLKPVYFTYCRECAELSFLQTFLAWTLNQRDLWPQTLNLFLGKMTLEVSVKCFFRVLAFLLYRIKALPITIRF